MKDELNQHLDGELPTEKLDREARGEAEAWERLLEAFRADLSSVLPPPWLETRVMTEIEALPEPGWLRRAFGWLLAPRPVRVSPLLAGTAVAAFIALMVLVIPTDGPDGQGREALVYVQFALEAPGAQSVVVAGDFDDWEGSHALMDVDGDGVWTGRVPVSPGVHEYMFLVDGSTWTTDPGAQRFVEDGFGNRNAVLAVAEPSA